MNLGKDKKNDKIESINIVGDYEFIQYKQTEIERILGIPGKVVKRKRKR